MRTPLLSLTVAFSVTLAGCGGGSTSGGTGACTPADCNDQDACTADACSAGTCTHTAVAVDDGNACTSDSCAAVAGVTHTPVPVDDGDPTTVDSCDPATGIVTHVQDCSLGCPSGFVDLDQNPLTGACGCEYACTPTSADDPLDAGFVDSNCDGSDGVVGACVFVATIGDDLAGIGTRQAPLRTIAAALQVASSNSVPGVCVGGGTYPEAVTLPGGRERAGCLAHLRRKFFEALSTAPAAPQRGMDFILDVYRVDRAAQEADILGTTEHLAMRQARSRPVMEAFRAWLEAEQPKHLPNGPMGEAVRYALNQWDALTLFLTDPRRPLDNNLSERSLRVCALGRKNFLFVGTDGAGENLAGLYSLIATCEVNGVNLVEYLDDVLLRVQTHPASRIDELLPHRWTRPQPKPSA